MIKYPQLQKENMDHSWSLIEHELFGKELIIDKMKRVQRGDLVFGEHNHKLINFNVY